MSLQEIRLMPECDLQAYAAYASQYGLPNERNRFLLAQGAWATLATMGGFTGSIQDLLGDRHEDKTSEENLVIEKGW